MTPRPTGRRQPCTQADARARLHDAEAFLDTAEVAKDADAVQALKPDAYPDDVLLYAAGLADAAA